MTVSSSQQMTVFLLSILAGIGCGIFFDFQRSIRRVYGSGAVTALSRLTARFHRRRSTSEY